MTQLDKEQELLDVEKRFWDAMKRKDAHAAEQMTDDGCIVVGAQGVSQIDRKTMAKLTTEGQWELEQYTFDSSKSRVRFISVSPIFWRVCVSSGVISPFSTI